MKNDLSATFLDYFKVLPLYLIPQHMLSRLVYHVARCQWVPFKNLLIYSFIKGFKVDMTIALEPNHRAYKHFNDFFTRELKPEARPIAQQNNSILCPVDGSISQIGTINSGEIFQAKNRSYNLDELLANDTFSNNFKNGLFATLYLAPKDYHRIHMPLDGQLLKTTYVPGRLFPVNRHTVRIVDRVFARNERVISYFETDIGLMAVIMVGAINVGSMETVWAGEITPASKRMITNTEYGKQDIHINRGQEMGRFNMGSTIILLVENNQLQWLPELVPGIAIKMGSILGLFKR